MSEPEQVIREKLLALGRFLASIDEPTSAAEDGVTESLAALDVLVAERDAFAPSRELLALLCAEDIRVNGCACTETSKCYLHGVYIPQAMSGELWEPPDEEFRFMHAAAVEYGRAEDAKARVAVLQAALTEADEARTAILAECDRRAAIGGISSAFVRNTFSAALGECAAPSSAVGAGEDEATRPQDAAENLRAGIERTTP